MAILGAHMSVAGGLEKAIDAAVSCQMDTVQIFTKNNNRWEGKALTDEQVTLWKQRWAAGGLRTPIAHASYLINLAAPENALWEKSIQAMVDELQRADRLGLAAVVVHPGAFTTSTEAAGISRVVEGVGRVLQQYSEGTVRLLLENTAGQGSCLGWSIEQLGQLFRCIAQPQRIGICFDTCHALAAGYDLTTASGFALMRDKICDLLPPEAICAMHVNDSKAALGKRVDRHEHIGLGCIGDQGFRLVLNDPLFRDLPMYLETPKGIDEASGEDWDQLNLARLRRLTETD
jgi:deoxyribonuclease IV